MQRTQHGVNLAVTSKPEKVVYLITEHEKVAVNITYLPDSSEIDQSAIE
jgi:hypothetical protein